LPGNSSASYYRARYYDPAVGRFLSEDQIGNDEGSNLYLYTRNEPITYGDPTGLYKLVGFPPGKAQQMNDAVRSAINVLKDSTCTGCAGSNAPNIIKALQNATFVYVPNLRTQDGSRVSCGNARPINSKTIHVGAAAFSASQCCRLDSTLAHEATHKITGLEEHGNPGPREVEDRCFGCN
jgi:hypothetical protein